MASKKTKDTKKKQAKKKPTPKPVPPTGGGQASFLTGMGGASNRG